MKKFLLTFCFIIFISLYSHAQYDTIPNASFENWYYTPIGTIEATGWQTNNSSVAAWNVFPDSSSYSGLLGLRIEKISYKGIIWSGFPLSHHPLTFECFVKNALSLGDSALIRIHIYSSNAIVDSGYAAIYGGIGTNYLPFSVNISQNVSVADSCVITLEGGNYTSAVSFDDLSFTFPSSVEEETGSSGWNIFPNPCSDVLTITGINKTSEGLTAALSDVTGKIIREEKISAPRNNCTVSMQFLSDGIYLIQLREGKKRSNHFIIKN